jgi:hypothetical protein
MKLRWCVPRDKTLVIFGSAQYKTFQRDLLERKDCSYGYGINISYVGFRIDASLDIRAF